MTKQKPRVIETEVRWDATSARWVATAPTSSGEKHIVPANSPSTALRRISTVLEKDYGCPVELEQKLHVPKETQAAYNEFQKKLRQFVELKEYITKMRMELGFRYVDEFNMPVTTVAPLLGLSAQRFGMMKQEWEMGITRGSVGRPRKNTDDDD